MTQRSHRKFETLISLGEFAPVVENILRCEPLALGETFDEKTGVQKFHETVSLTIT
jgi:hypothetical protein